MFEQLPVVDERDRGDGTGEALLVIDVASGSLSYVNAAARELFATQRITPATMRAADVLPELQNLAIRNFVACIVRDGRERRLAVRVEPLHGANPAEPAAVLATIRRIDGAGAAAALPTFGGKPAARRLERLESLWALLVGAQLGGAAQVRALLRAGAEALSLERAALARLDGDELVVEFTDPAEDAGARVPLERSLSRAALTRSGTFAVLDTRANADFERVASDVRCFLASAFRVGDVRWVVTFSSLTARQGAFDDDDWSYVENVIEALSRCLERGARDAHIERLAYSDALTALPNRIAVLGRLDEAIAEAERLHARVAVLFLDIDGFKNVNDTVGHGGGDIVLAEVAQRLRGTLRKDEYIGRLGGDEFAIVMPQLLDREEVESIAQRIGGVLTFPFAVDECRFSLSASIGVAVYPDDATEREALLACADTAMYAAKDDGGSRVRFREAARVSEDLVSGPISSVTGEPRDLGYALCYQPTLDLRSGGVVAAEALVRRVHPVHGLLPPGRGWAIAQDRDGRRALDRWVLREAASQARAWNGGGASLRVDVKFAAFDPAEIDELLEDRSLAAEAGHLRVEIGLERFIAADAEEQIPAFAERCSAAGMTLALDGFDGTLGALASLAHLPFEAVKLARPLTDTVLTSRTSRAIIEGTSVVARSLGWSIVGKGVESVAQRDALASLGCDEIAGYYVAHPMTATDFGKWLGEHEGTRREA